MVRSEQYSGGQLIGFSGFCQNSADSKSEMPPPPEFQPISPKY